MRRRNWTAIKRERERALKRRIGNAEMLALLSGATAVLTFVFGGVLRAANALYSRTPNGGEIVLRPSPFSLYMAGGVAAFLAAFFTCEHVHRRLLGTAPEAFSADYMMAVSPYPSWLKRAIVICLAIAILVAILNVRKHATIGSVFIDDQLALALVPDRYALNEVSSVEMSRFYIAATKYSPPRISDAPALFVRFRDGRIWSPQRAELDVRDQASLAEVIASRSGEPVRYTSAIEGIPDEAGVRRRTRVVVSVGAGSLMLAGALWAVRRYMRTRRQPVPTSRRKPGRKIAR
jgi:hypothetical protein